MWKEQLDQLPKMPILGNGAFGTVYRINYEGRYAALKHMDRASIENFEEMEREIQMLSLAKHRNIVQLYDATMVQSKVYLLMEYVDGGSLHNFLQSRTNIPYSSADGISWMLQAAEGLAYLHAMNPIVIHRDVKPLNMLIDKNRKTLKICDFGTVRYIKNTMSAQQGTPHYMAPEVIKGRHYNEKCDSYSMGITIWHVMSRRIPYASKKLNTMDLMNAVADKDLRPEMSELREECPQSLKDFMRTCWDADSSKRPSMQEIVEFLR